MHPINLSLVFIAGLNVGMAFIIFLRNPKNKINISLGASIFLLGAWSFALSMFRGSDNSMVAQFWTYAQSILGGLIVIPLFLFSIFFPYQNFLLKRITLYLTFLSYLPVLIVILYPGWWVKTIIVNPPYNDYVYNKIGIIIFSVYFFTFISLTFYYLFKKYIESSGYAKKQLFTALLALGTTAFFGSIFSVLVPLLSLSGFSLWLGPFFSLPMVLMFTYFMLRTNEKK